MLNKILLVAAGSAFGGVSRMLFYELEQLILGQRSLLATFVVNVLGCFLIGLLFAFTLQKKVSSNVEFLLIVGFLGSFTTFSTYILDFHKTMGPGFDFKPVLYLAGSIIIGYLALQLGLGTVK